MPSNNFGQIVGGGLARLGEVLEQGAEKKKRELQAGKASLALAKALSPEARRALGLPDDTTLAGMSALDITSTVAGAIHGQGVNEGVSLANERLQAAQERNAQAGRNQALGLDLARYAPPGDLAFDIPPEDFQRYSLPEGQATPAAPQLFQSAARTGNLMNPQLDNLALSMERAQPKAGEAPLALEFGDVPDTNYKSWRLGKSAGMLPKTGGTLAQATDDEGNPIENVFVGPKGNIFQPSQKKDVGTITPRDEYTQVMRQLTALYPFAGLAENKLKIAELEKRRDALLKGGASHAAGEGGPSDELRLATEALKAGASRAKVAAKYKQRTGQDLPP